MSGQRVPYRRWKAEQEMRQGYELARNELVRQVEALREQLAMDGRVIAARAQQIRELYDAIKAGRELIRMSMVNDSHYAALASEVLGTVLTDHSESAIEWISDTAVTR